jgi:hypothetical protein
VLNGVVRRELAAGRDARWIGHYRERVCQVLRFLPRVVRP